MTSPPPRPIFHGPRPQGPQRRTLLAAAHERHPQAFPTPEDAAKWMELVFVPHSKRWAFVRNGKAGTTSTLQFLFELEFGCPFTARVTLPGDLNPDAAAQQLASADVFRPLSGFPRGLDAIDGALRLATVRHPTSRVVSAFNYICQTHDAAHPWFHRERLRMNAVVGFDWTADCRTPTGLVKFLRYIDRSLQGASPQAMNSHWRPQVATVLPEVYRPHIVGKVEALDDFFAEIAARLGQDLPPGWRTPRANASRSGEATQALLDPEARDLIARLYADDFAAFGYDPAWIQPAP